jgi:hypothetical protein
LNCDLQLRAQRCTGRASRQCTKSHDLSVNGIDQLQDARFLRRDDEARKLTSGDGVAAGVGYAVDVENDPILARPAGGGDGVGGALFALGRGDNVLQLGHFLVAAADDDDGLGVDDAVVVDGDVVAVSDGEEDLIANALRGTRQLGLGGLGVVEGFFFDLGEGAGGDSSG